MSVKRFSSRYLRWTAARVATSILPSLQNRMPMYHKVVRFTDAGRTQFFEETQTLTLSPTEAEAGRRTQEGVPANITRSIALVALADATILGNTGSVIDEAHERLIVQRDGRNRPTYHEFRGEMTERIVRKDGVYFNMLGPHRCHRHHFHFLIDYLPRLYYFLERFAEGHEPVTVLVNEDLSPLQTNIFGVLAAQYRNVRFEAVPQRERWTLPLLYHIDDLQIALETGYPVQHSLMNPQYVQFLRNTVFAACNFTPDNRNDRRVYISRIDAKKRKILNEHALADILQRSGFETVVAGTMSLQEQVAIFSQSGVICGAHGAGLTNMLFAPPGAHIIEILPEDRQMAIYLLIAKSAGHSYEAVPAGPGGYRQNFNVSADAIAHALAMAGETARSRTA